MMGSRYKASNGKNAHHTDGLGQYFCRAAGRFSSGLPASQQFPRDDKIVEAPMSAAFARAMLRRALIIIGPAP